MEASIPPFLVYHETYQFLACKIHRAAIHPSKLQDHVTKLHQDDREYPGLRDLALQPLLACHQAIQADQPVRPLDGLVTQPNGLCCTLCNKAWLSQRNIRNHIRDDHQIQGSWKVQDSYWVQRPVQTLEQSRYIFLVDTGPLEMLESPAPTGHKRNRPGSMEISGSEPPQTQPRMDNPTRPHDLATRVRKRYQAKLSQLRNTRTIQTHGATYEAHSFHRESKYPEFLNGRDGAELEALFILENPRRSTYLSTAIQHLLDEGQSLVAETSRPALMQLNSFAPGHMTLRPFRVLQNHQTVQKYARVFKAFLIFLLNSYRAQESGQGPSSIVGLYRLSPANNMAVRKLESWLAGLSEPGILPEPDPVAARPPPWDDELEDSDDDSEIDLPPRNTVTLLDPRDQDIVTAGSTIILDLGMELMEQNMADPMKSPLNSFLACYSRDYRRDCFKPVGILSQIHSAIIKVHQFLFLANFHRNIYHGESEMEMVAYFQDWMTQYFSSRSESPLGHVLALRNIALFLIGNDTSLGEVSLIGPETLKYRQIQVSRSDLTAFLVHAIQDLAQDLANNLFLGFENFQQFHQMGFSLEQASQYERFNNPTRNFSVISNPAGEAASQLLISSILDNHAYREKWFVQTMQDGQPQLQLKPAMAHQYFRMTNQFLKHLLALCHLTSGAPARGTEINQVIWQNSSTVLRNLYLDPSTKLFLIQLAYSKNFARFGANHAVRVLPESISYCILAYLMVIRPFETFLCIELGQDPPDNDFLLFIGMNTRQMIHSQVLSRTLKALSHQFLGQEISIGPWRHITKALIRYGMKEDPSPYFRNEEDDPYDLEVLGAKQMSHSWRTGQRVYGGVQTSIRGVIPNDQEALVSFSQRWHAYLGLAPGQLPLGSLFYGKLARSHTRTERVPVAPPVPTPLAHPVVQVKYPGVAGKTPPSQAISIGEFQEFLSLHGSAFDSAGTEETVPPGELDQAQRVRKDRHPLGSLPKLNTGILEHMLQEFLQDRDARFRSPQQLEAFFQLLMNRPYLFMILPTAGGKTTLFLLGASLATRKTSIIISPLIALKLDLHTKASRLGLDPVVWDDSCDFTSSRLVLAQIEDVSKARFLIFLGNMLDKQQIERVIWDECHMIPLTKHYRTQMHRSDHVLQFPVPMVFSSATLSHAIQTELIQMMNLQSSGQIPMVRADLALPNMAYYVTEIPKEACSTAKYPKYLYLFLSEFEKKYHPVLPRPRACVIVFCMTKVLAKQLYQALSQPEYLGNAVAYFHADLTEPEKMGELHRFQGHNLGGEARVLLATSAIGAGFDFQYVDAVFHLEGSYGLSDFLQESGRCARDPRRSGWSYCLIRPTDRTPRASDSQEQLEFKKYLNEQRCRRRPISQNFNAAIQTCGRSWQLCDLCLAKQNQFQLVIQATQQKYQEISQEQEFLATAVKYFHDTFCLVCLGMGIKGNRSLQTILKNYHHCQHPYADCPYFTKTFSKTNQDFVKLLAPRKDTCCFRCYLPTKVCKGPLETNNGESCLDQTLIILFWKILERWGGRFQKNLDVELFQNIDLPINYSPTTFLEDSWLLDTEFITGAKIFYKFSKEFFRIFNPQC